MNGESFNWFNVFCPVQPTTVSSVNSIFTLENILCFTGEFKSFGELNTSAVSSYISSSSSGCNSKKILQLWRYLTRVQQCLKPLLSVFVFYNHVFKSLVITHYEKAHHSSDHTTSTYQTSIPLQSSQCITQSS